MKCASGSRLGREPLPSFIRSGFRASTVRPGRSTTSRRCGSPRTARRLIGVASRRPLRLPRQRSVRRTSHRRSLRRAHERSGRHDVVALGSDRQLESRAALSGRHRLASLFRQTLDHLPGRLGLRDGAARRRRAAATRIDFAVTPLNMLVDSPLDMGRYVKKWDLWRDGSAFVQLDAFADHPQDLDIPAEAAARVPARAGRGVRNVRLAAF